jgi:hypothetical protein
MIRKQDLGVCEFIAKGGVGSVYRLPNFTIAGCPPLAYKEVHPVAPDFTPHNRQQAVGSMIKSVAFRAALSPADRDDLDEYTTWPIDVVEENGAPCGIVMPLIPPDFFVRTNPQTGPAQTIVLDLSWLSAKDSQAQVEGIDRSGFRDVLVRIALLTQLVYAVGRLHRHGIVYGDLSLKNAALAVNPPRIKLLDCDAVAPLADQARDQLHSPFFKPPENLSGAQKLQDDRTDVYKLGLCVIRALQQGKGVSQTKNPAGLTGKLDRRAIDVVARAVDVDRSRRPSAKELFDALESNLLAKASPPTIRSAALSRQVALRGQDVEIVWNASGGKEVRITGPNGLDITLADSGATPARYVITPPASGEVAVEVSNPHGSVRAVAGDVQLYELPSFQVDLTGLPQPSTLDVPAVEIPSVLRHLPPIPMMSTATHPVPRVELPALTPVSEALAEMRSVPAPFERLAAAGLAAGAQVKAAGNALDPMRPRPDLARMASTTTESVHELFDEARTRLRDRVARDVDKALRRGVARP